MKIDVQEFIDKINNNDFEVQTTETTLADLSQNPIKSFKPLLQFMEEQINLGHLASAMLHVKDEDTSFFLQNCIVNLPYRYSKNISKIMSDDEACALNIYMIVESPDVNRSKLRIDELSSQDEFSDNDQLEKKISEWAKNKLNSISENKAKRLKAEEELSKKTKSKKKTTKSKKKTTKRKKTIKK